MWDLMKVRSSGAVTRPAPLDLRMTMMARIGVAPQDGPVVRFHGGVGGGTTRRYDGCGRRRHVAAMPSAAAAAPAVVVLLLAPYALAVARRETVARVAELAQVRQRRVAQAPLLLALVVLLAHTRRATSATAGAGCHPGRGDQQMGPSGSARR